MMKQSKLTLALLATLSMGALGLTACDKPTVVNVPPTESDTVVVPGPAGAPGAPGQTGDAGKPGEKGDPGVQGDTNVIVTPPAESSTTTESTTTTTTN